MHGRRLIYVAVAACLAVPAFAFAGTTATFHSEEKGIKKVDFDVLFGQDGKKVEEVHRFRISTFRCDNGPDLTESWRPIRTLPVDRIKPNVWKFHGGRHAHHDVLYDFTAHGKLRREELFPGAGIYSWYAVGRLDYLYDDGDFKCRIGDYAFMAFPES